MNIVYIRVSCDEQTTALQEDAIWQAQCERVFTNKMSGIRDDRPQFLAMLDMARWGGCHYHVAIDRLDRSLKQLTETVTQLNECGIELSTTAPLTAREVTQRGLGCRMAFHLPKEVNALQKPSHTLSGTVVLRSIKENIDTTTPTGKLMSHIIGVMAEFERNVIQERTLTGLDAARARGKRGGRPKATETIKPRDIALAKDLYAAKEKSIADIMRLIGFKSRNTFYKYVVKEEK